MEKYSPTAKDIKAAENTMTEAQKNLSVDREEHNKELEQLGVSGYLYMNGNITKDQGVFLEGNLNGHDVKIKYWFDGDDRIIEGTLDGIKMQPEDAEKLRGKYERVAMMKKIEEIEINHSVREIENHHLKEALKELL